MAVQYAYLPDDDTAHLLADDDLTVCGKPIGDWTYSQAGEICLDCDPVEEPPKAKKKK